MQKRAAGGFYVATIGIALATIGTSAVLAQDSILTRPFQLMQPGLSISTFQDIPLLSTTLDPCDTDLAATFGGSFACEDVVNSPRPGYGTDALGRFYQVTQKHDIAAADIERKTDPGIETVARLPECANVTDQSGIIYQQHSEIDNLTVDGINGYLYLVVLTDLRPGSCGTTATRFQRAFGVVRIAGVSSLLDIIATSQPSTTTVAWTTPRYPEGLSGADRFQVFAGDVHDLPDFTRAVPVECSVTGAGAPQPGELMSVADPLSIPRVGSAVYMLVGVESGTQRRFGRQYVNGLMSGRNAAEFAACSAAGT